MFFAHINTQNVVDDVIVVDGPDFVAATYPDDSQRWVMVDLDTSPSLGYVCGIGRTYDTANNVFIAPKPFASWVLNSSFRWEAPIEYPTSEDGDTYWWDEESLQWVIAPGA